jgi:hypothetical protein
MASRALALVGVEALKHPPLARLRHRERLFVQGATSGRIVKGMRRRSVTSIFDQALLQQRIDRPADAVLRAPEEIADALRRQRPQ